MLLVAHLEQTYRRQGLADCFVRAREAGFDGVELVIGPGCTCELSEPEASCRALAHQANQCGTRVHSVLLADDPEVRIGAAGADRRSESCAHVRAALHRCRWLGAQTLRLIPAKVGTGAEGAGHAYQDALNDTCLSLETLRIDFERCGVVVGVMPCHHRFLLSPPEFRELIDRVNSPLVAAALDWTACALVGEPADWIRTLRRRLAAVSIEANVLRGSADSDALLKPLREVRFDGPLILIGEACSAGAFDTLRNLPS